MDNRSYEKDRFKIQIFDDIASGSPQFSLKQLHDLVNQFQKKHIVIIDLRQEFHWFVHDHDQWISCSLFEPNFLYNREKSSEDILRQETEMCQEINYRSYIDMLHVICKGPAGQIRKSKKLRIVRKSHLFCLTEEQLIQKYFPQSCTYYRVSIQDHEAIGANVLGVLKKIIEKHSHDWIHFHCRGGSGRTSQALLLIDILKNKNRFTFKEYVQREIDRGGANLWKCKYRKRLEKIKKLIGF